MTNQTCLNCGFTGDEINFKNGPRGRKIHGECQKCRDELSKLVDEYRMIQMYFQKYYEACRVLTLKDKYLLDRFIESTLTPSYMLDGQFLGTLHDSHFVPIANLAYEHAKLDLEAGANLIEKVKMILGDIVTIEPNMQFEKKEWERQTLLKDMATFDKVETGKGLLLKTDEPKKKGFLSRLLGI